MTMMRSPEEAQKVSYMAGLRIIRGRVSGQDQRGRHAFRRDAKSIDDALRILPFVEASCLHDERQVSGYAVALKMLRALSSRDLPVDQGKRINRRHDEPLRNVERLRILWQGEHGRIVALDHRRQVGPRRGKGRRQIDMAAPDPALLPAHFHKGKRLRVMHNDDIVVVEPRLRSIGAGHIAVHSARRRELDGSRAGV